METNDKRRVFEHFPDLANYLTPSAEAIDEVSKNVYSRYLEYMERGHPGREPLTFVQFLLTRAVETGFNSFFWPKDTLVRCNKTGAIGIVTGWSDLGFSAPRVGLDIRTAHGEKGLFPEEVTRAEIPPEVLEYVASTLKDKVHGKVDEAFDGEAAT